MKSQYIDIAKLKLELSLFEDYVHCKDEELNDTSNHVISFVDMNGYLGQEENYKSRVAVRAREALDCKHWNTNWIGSTKIATCASNAVYKSDNLVNRYQRIAFANKCDPKHADFKPEVEETLYAIFRGNDEEAAFKQAVSVFGGSYDLIAFFFFIKDDTRFLPISSGIFEKAFDELGIEYKLQRRCS